MKIFPVLTAMLITGALSSCGSARENQTISKQSTPVGEILYQYKWDLQELGGKGITSFKTAFLQFSPGQVIRVSGNSGCNNMAGAVELSGERGMRFSQMAVTRMACLGDYDEAPFLNMLQKVTEWRISGQELFLYNGRDQLARFTGVSLGAGQSQVVSDINGTWELVYITGPRISFDGLYPEQKPELIINTLSNEANGNSSCNLFGCSITIQDNRISFGEPRLTRMYCPGNGEETFLSMLKKVNRFSVEDNSQLVLLMDETPVMKFKRK